METQPEIIETHTDEEPLLKETKKVKKQRSQKQLDAFELARQKRLQNITAKKMAVKEKEVADYKKQKVEIEPVKEVIEEELTPNNPEYDSEEEVKPKPKPKAKPKKRKAKTPPPSESDDSSSSEEEYIIRKRKPVRNKGKTKVVKQELEEIVEPEQERYYQNIIFV